MSSFYPETSNLTLEEVDHLFTKDGSDGLKKFTRRSQPVQESLKPLEEIERDAGTEKSGLHKRGSGSESPEHIDHIDDKAS